MANEFENSLKEAAAKVADYVKNVSELKVTTRWVTLDADGAADFAQAKPAAFTRIALDGDCETIIPVRQTPNGAQVEDAVFALHKDNVANATAYRAQILGALMSALRTATRR